LRLMRMFGKSIGQRFGNSRNGNMRRVRGSGIAVEKQIPTG
jgi:hypothetical protein